MTGAPTPKPWQVLALAADLNATLSATGGGSRFFFTIPRSK